MEIYTQSYIMQAIFYPLAFGFVLAVLMHLVGLGVPGEK
jgi:hypothetical protein